MSSSSTPSSNTPSYHWVGTPSSSTSAAIVPTGASYTSNEMYQPVVNRPIRAEQRYDEFGYEEPAKPWLPSSSTGSSSTGSSSAAAVVRPPLSLEEREKALWLINFSNPEEDEFNKTLDELSPPISLKERVRRIEERREEDFIKLLIKAKIPPEEHYANVLQWRKTPYTTTLTIKQMIEENDPVGASEGGRRRRTRHKQHKKRPRKHRRRCSTRRR